MTERREILLIDEEALPRLDVEGFRLSRICDAETALAAARALDFELVLVAAARADAPALISRLSAPEGCALVVIALTGGADPAAAQPYLAAGAVDWTPRAETDAPFLARALRYAAAQRGCARALRKAREDAEAKAQALARGDREKAMILSVIAHDLRNPFQVLLSNSRALAETAAADAVLARRAGGLHSAAARAHGVLERLYDWAAQRQNARARAPGPFAAEALLRDAFALWRERAESRGVMLECRRSELWIAAHEEACATILRNLVDNALKFTPAGGRVCLYAERLGDRVALCVGDSGVGMSPARAASLFASERRAVTAEGGLGLLLCRDLADWIGAALEVESRPGAGSTFRLLAPETVALAPRPWPARRAPAPEPCAASTG